MQLGLLSINKEELVRAHDPKTTEEREWQSVDPGLQESGFQFFRFQKLLGGIPWGAALKRKGAQESWQVFEVRIFQAREWDTPILRETNRHMRRPAWFLRDLMAELQCGKGSISEAEAGVGYRGGIYKHCLGMQGWCLEIQSLTGDGNCEGYQRQQEEFVLLR